MPASIEIEQVSFGVRRRNSADFSSFMVGSDANIIISPSLKLEIKNPYKGLELIDEEVNDQPIAHPKFDPKLGQSLQSVSNMSITRPAIIPNSSVCGGTKLNGIGGTSIVPSSVFPESS